MTEIREVIEDIYGAWCKQDLDRVATYLPHEFRHTINFPPRLHHLGGTREGKPAVLTRLGQIFSEFEFVWFDTSGLMAGHDRAAVQIHAHCQHRKTGIPLLTLRGHFWTLEGGWPTALYEYFDISQVEEFVSAVAAQCSD